VFVIVPGSLSQVTSLLLLFVSRITDNHIASSTSLPDSSVFVIVPGSLLQVTSLLPFFVSRITDNHIASSTSLPDSSVFVIVPGVVVAGHLSSPALRFTHH